MTRLFRLVKRLLQRNHFVFFRTKSRFRILSVSRLIKKKKKKIKISGGKGNIQCCFLKLILLRRILFIHIHENEIIS